MNIIVAALLAQIVAASGSPYALAPESKLWIEGDSNVHAWACDSKKVQATIFADPDSPVLARGLFLYIPISGIDCGNGTMNGKLRDALHQEAHPAILYKLSSIERVDGDALVVSGELTINGQKRDVHFSAVATRQPDGSVRANGAVKLLMSDFGVEPPSALFLKTKDQITVKFDLRATPRPAQHASQP